MLAIQELQAQVKEATKELSTVEQESSQLKTLVDALRLPDKREEFEYKRLSLHLDKMKKMIGLKSRADESSIRMNLKLLNQKEVQNAVFESKLEEMDYLVEDQVSECLGLLEMIKQAQNRRMTAMMQIIDEKVYRSNSTKHKVVREGLSTTGEQFDRRDSSVSEMLGNYDPSVRALLEKSMRPRSRLHEEPLASGLKSPPSRFSREREEAQTDRMNTKATSRTQRDFSGAFDEDDFQEVNKQPKREQAQFPSKGKDYLVSKAKKF